MYALDTASLTTPIGLVTIVGEDDHVTSVTIGTATGPTGATAKAVREAVAQLRAYFDGRLTAFDLPLADPATPRGGALRRAIVDIGFGRTASYGDLARSASSSPRAVGQACARNPFPLIVPCHRILPTGGALGRYSAGDGQATKRWLIDFEARTARPKAG